MINIKVTKRDKSTTGFTNKLRADGFIPAILYGPYDSLWKIYYLNFLKLENLKKDFLGYG